MVKSYKKIHKYLAVVEYFALRQWNFTNENVTALWGKMGEQDRHLFEFSMATFDWDVYLRTYVRGCRVYLLKDPLDTIAKGAIRFKKLQIAHYALLIILAVVLYTLLSVLFGLVF